METTDCFQYDAYRHKFSIVSDLQHYDKQLVKYSCGSFFAQAYDSHDRENLLSGEGADIYIKNCLLIAAKGLASKWENVLEGDTMWLEKYKSSSRYAKENLTADERTVFEKCFI